MHLLFMKLSALYYKESRLADLFANFVITGNPIS